MTTYTYRARSQDGAVVTGVVEAYDEFTAVEQLRSEQLLVEELKEVKAKKKDGIRLNEPLWVSDKALALAASQFGIMLRAGLPMSRVVELIADQTSDKLMKRILTDCAADVAAGYSLARSIEKNGKKIPAVFIETVRAGEESGTLETSFESLQTYYTKQHKTRQKVKSALMYPTMVIILAVIVIGIVMVVLIPTMTGIFESMSMDLPIATRMLIGMSKFFQKAWPFLLIAVALIGFGLYSYGKTENGKIRYSKIRLRMPVIGKITVASTAAQIANTMSTLLAGGLPVTQVIDIVSRVLDSRSVGRDLGRCVGKLETGMSLGAVLRDVEDIPPMLVEMAQVGEQSGSLESTLATIGEYYDDEATVAADRALGMLEPAITIALGLGVAFIVIAVYMPMFQMYNGIGGGAI